MSTFRDYINEGIWNKIKNFSAENIEIGRYLQSNKSKNGMPENLYVVKRYDKSEDIVIIEDVDNKKQTTYTIKEYFKNGPATNADWLGERVGSGYIAYMTWKEVLKTNVTVILYKKLYNRY